MDQLQPEPADTKLGDQRSRNPLGQALDELQGVALDHRPHTGGHGVVIEGIGQCIAGCGFARGEAHLRP